jgi:hypothetical protein
VLAIWFSGWGIRGKFADVEIAMLKAEHREVLVDLDRQHREKLQTMTDEVRATERAHVDAMAALDARYNQEMTDAKRETETLAAAVRAGELRLRNRFTCPSTSASAGVPAAGTGSSVNPATASGGLRNEDAELLIRLAAEADDVVRQLTACQAIITADRR